MSERKGIYPYLEEGVLKCRCFSCDKDAQFKLRKATVIEMFCVNCGEQAFYQRTEPEKDSF